MLPMIVIGVLIVGIAFYQAIQGTFSALIMTILTIVCSAVALNYYEPVGQMLSGRLSAYADAVALVALFVLPLLILRELFDRFIKGTVLLGVWPDRLGGGFFGLLTGTFLMGMLVLVIELLPLGGSYLGYRPYDETLRPLQGGPPKIAANITLGVAKLLSAGSLQPMGEGRKFGDTHSDLRLEAFCNRNRPPEAMAWAPADTLRITDAFSISEAKPDDTGKRKTAAEIAARNVILKAPKNPLLATDKDGQVIAVRMTIEQTPPGEAEVWQYQLPATHFRLITESGRSYYPVDYLTHAGGWRLNAEKTADGYSKIADLVIVRPWEKAGGPARLSVDWIYRIGAGEKPASVVFRRSSSAPVPGLIDGAPRVADEKNRRQALGVKPVVGEAKFAAPADGANRLLWPTLMMLDTAFSSFIRLQFDPGTQDPNVFRQLVVAEQGSSQLKAVDVSGPTDKVTTGRQSLHQYVTSGPGYVVVQVVCEVKKDFRVTGAARQSLMALSPRVVLADGRYFNHSGAGVIYDAPGGEQIVMYYDSNYPSIYRQLVAEFANKLLDNAARVKKLRFVFILPKSNKQSIVAVDMGVAPEYNFSAPTPLLTARQ